MADVDDAPTEALSSADIARRLVLREFHTLPDFSPEEYREWDRRLMKANIRKKLEGVVARLHDDLPAGVAASDLIGELVSELTSLGPLERLMSAEGISEVMINRYDEIYVEKGGRLHRIKNLKFRDDTHVLSVARQILGPLGKRIDSANPLADARMPDGSRVNVVTAPLSPKGTTITIRRFSPIPFTGMDLVKFGSMSPNMLNFLMMCVQQRINVVVSGGTGSGKTTLLNVLSGFIPAHERIVTIEDSAELQLAQEHVVSLEARETGVSGSKITIRELVRNSLRMRPDRIVVGECRGSEAIDMLQAMNTGHDGSLTTLHANGPRDALARIETMILMGGVPLPTLAIRQQVASAIQILVHQSRFADGTRKVTHITELTGIQKDVILMHDLFTFKHMGYDPSGKVRGRFACRGMVPKLVGQLRENGIEVDLGMFAKSAADPDD